MYMRSAFSVFLAAPLLLSACQNAQAPKPSLAENTSAVSAANSAERDVTSAGLTSPDGRNSFSVTDAGGQLRYTVSRADEVLIDV